MLREVTFPGDGYGCYSTFEVREAARKWAHRERVNWWRGFGYGDDEESGTTAKEAADMGAGYSYEIGGYQINVCWFWDGDGILTFEVCDSTGYVLRRLENNDCKKSYRWEDVA